MKDTPAIPGTGNFRRLLRNLRREHERMDEPKPGEVYERDGEFWQVYRVSESGTVFMRQVTTRLRAIWQVEWKSWADEARRIEVA